jgi:hypothetical protein
MERATNDFVREYNNFHKRNLEEYETIQADSGRVKLFRQKYKYFDPKNTIKKSLIHEMFSYDGFEHFNNPNMKRHIFEMVSKKIRGMFKHGQACKTELSCEKILSDVRKNILSLAITKNTLLAGGQFTTRFIARMRKAGYEDMKKHVMVINSKENNLGGNATHCRNIDEAWSIICDTNNQFKVIFMCSNNTRIKDILVLLERFRFLLQWKKEIVIHYDEAHNKNEGIPVYRNYVENILLYDFVKELVPITASSGTIFDSENPVWNKENLILNRLNFINQDMVNSRIKSDSPAYSSIRDAIEVDVDEVFPVSSSHDNFICELDFKRVYPSSTHEDYVRKGRLNFCRESFIGDEELSMNCAKEILNNNQDIKYETYLSEVIIEEKEEKIFLPNTANFHVICTPSRRIVTYSIMKYAVSTSYNPVTIGLFGGSIHYRFKDLQRNSVFHGEFIVDENSSNKEFNDRLFEFLEAHSLLSRCVIIIGNYQSVGESNTLVNSKYGYLRSAILLRGCKLTAEQRYQFFLRCCFVVDKFKIDNPDWKKEDITKFVIGDKESIQDAKTYETQNDELVQDLIDSPEEENVAMSFTSLTSNTSSSSNSNSTSNTRRSIPIQFKIEDNDSEHVTQLVDIMRKLSRDESEKADFMTYLTNSIMDSSVVFIDHNVPKITLPSFKLKEFRCYRSGDDLRAGNEITSYRFKNYRDHFEQKMPYKNGELKKMECEIHCCVNKYVLELGGGAKFINNPNTFYMTFAY